MYEKTIYAFLALFLLTQTQAFAAEVSEPVFIEPVETHSKAELPLYRHIKNSKTRSVLLGYLQNERADLALRLFSQAQSFPGLKSNLKERK